MTLDYKVIPHNEQRYSTAGDYWWEGDLAFVRVSDTGNTLYNFLLGNHELTEMLLVRAQGQPDLSTEFDMAYELARKMKAAAPCGCEPTEFSEPGDDPHAPYHDAHVVATKCERLLAERLGVKWEEYEEAVEKLFTAPVPAPAAPTAPPKSQP